MNDLLVAGYFGYSNFGDDLILETFFRNFTAEKSRIWLLTLKPFIRTRWPEGVHPVFRYDLISILWLFLTRKSLKVVFPGGEIFQSRTSRRSPLYYMFFILLARFFRKPYFLLFQGFHPEMMDESSAERIRGIFRNAEFACIRDHDLKWIQTAFGPSRVEPCGDFSLQYDLQPWKDAVPGDTFLIALKPHSGNEEWTVRAILEGLASEFPGVSFLFFTSHKKQDSAVSYRMVRYLHEKRPADDPGRFYVSVWDDVKSAIDLIASARFVFSMRYHPALMALRLGRPCFVLGDDPRLAVFRK
jgi:polysaccharide pyruvyl transferase WcaK-like protein